MIGILGDSIELDLVSAGYLTSDRMGKVQRDETKLIWSYTHHLRLSLEWLSDWQPTYFFYCMFVHFTGWDGMGGDESDGRFDQSNQEVA